MRALMTEHPRQDLIRCILFLVVTKIYSFCFFFRVPVPDGLLDFVFNGRLLVVAFVAVADLGVGCADVEFAAVEVPPLANVFL